MSEEVLRFGALGGVLSRLGILGTWRRERTRGGEVTEDLRRASQVGGRGTFHHSYHIFRISILVAIAFAFGVGINPAVSGSEELQIARLKYAGGGDWYNDPSMIPNLCAEINTRTSIEAASDQAVVAISDDELFRYPFLFMTGHGNISFSDLEVERLRSYLTNGGFLYCDDDYGIDEHFRREMGKTFPEKEFVEVPYNHEIYHIFYDFPDGLPKIHKHDGKPPKGYGLFHEERMVVYYTYETNISDGWADPEVHNDPPEKREAAFRMGVNIVMYALTH
jgi:hypothetical protein